MIRTYLTRIASYILSSQRKDPREAYRAKARQMYRDQGKPVPEALR
ncbi:hypothetical protein [Sphingopyxis sp.]|nr:hypothetical protein [Sphingopyxis sp.]MBK6414135.1 hypothetical protein [Sphingopyxis sp.]